MTDLAGKRAVVTGAASGIGAAIVRRFASDGAEVLALDRDPKVAELDSDLISHHLADVTDVEQMGGAFDEVMRRWDGLDILVNAAGVLAPAGPIHETTIDDFDRVMAVNVRGVFLSMRAAIPLLLRRPSSAIINIASISSFVTQGRSSPYAASKGAVLMLTKSAAVEYGDRGIRVNAICPGTIETPLLEGRSPEFVENLRRQHVVGRIGRPEEVAAMAAFLASDECTFATGAPFIVDGGRTAS